MSPHPDAIFAGPLTDDWFGFRRGPDVWPASHREVYERLMRDTYGDPPPTHEALVARCQAMGLVLCSCTGVETEQGHRLIYDPTCPIHHGERRGVRDR